MAMITCPECSNRISDRAEICPHCGLPRCFFNPINDETNISSTTNQFSGDYNKIKAMLMAFSSEWRSMFGAQKYIARSDAKSFFDKYIEYGLNGYKKVEANE